SKRRTKVERGGAGSAKSRASPDLSGSGLLFGGAGDPLEQVTGRGGEERRAERQRRELVNGQRDGLLAPDAHARRVERDLVVAVDDDDQQSALLRSAVRAANAEDVRVRDGVLGAEVQLDHVGYELVGAGRDVVQRGFGIDLAERLRLP